MTKFRQYMREAGLSGTRNQAHTVDSIAAIMSELRAMYPNAGHREMKNLLFHERQMAVSRYVS
jgi:hypothetical protein